VLRVFVGIQNSDSLNHTERVFQLETNIDDMNPQLYEVIMERLFEAGALDSPDANHHEAESARHDCDSDRSLTRPSGFAVATIFRNSTLEYDPGSGSCHSASLLPNN